VIKPLLDRIGAFLLLVLTFPVLIMCVLLLSFANSGKIWFIQPRPGRHGRIFRIIKFKTMNDDRDDQGNLLPDEKRLTRIGIMIRKTSLDELPQLINVLKGDMSFVGPRPLLVEYLPLYNDAQRKRHQVRPGITGWAQVNGRNTISWHQRFMYDQWYVENISFFLDVKILYLTVLKVFRAEGINSATSASMEKFSGKN
jgi:undecaprenyl phosphate N,N'-diacetylbacillosamine 1-phosphate transferase